jgi:uncharacterized membrane protein (UPF0136 family)
MKILLIIYSCILFSGAYFGSKAGSKVSVYMGIISGALVLLSVYLINMNPKCGYWSAASISGLLSVVFMIRLAKTHMFMPAGMLLVTSAVILIMSAIQISKL